jgi:hypothetical protein
LRSFRNTPAVAAASESARWFGIARTSKLLTSAESL